MEKNDKGTFSSCLRSMHEKGENLIQSGMRNVMGRCEHNEKE